MKIRGLALGLWFSFSAAADPAGQRVLECVRHNLPNTETIEDIEMIAADRSGAQRTLQGRIYVRVETEAGKPAVRSLVARFDAPRDLSGAAYLVRRTGGRDSDQMYIFLPALQRVRRVSGSAAGDSLFGTSFSYSDFQELESAFDQADAALEPSVQNDPGPAQILSIKPAPSASPYTLIRGWIDPRTCLPLRWEFYAGSVLRKTFQASADAQRHSGRYWYPSESVMRDLVTGSVTTLHIKKVVSDASIPRAYFEPNSFYLSY